MRVSLGPASVALIVVLLSGCAARRPPETSARRQLNSTALTASTIEALDKRLGAALMTAEAVKSAENDVAVAREYYRLHILDHAEKWLQRAVRRSPRYAAAHEMRARLWREWGLLAGALGHAHRAVVFAPKSASARNTLGTVLDALGRFEEARAAYLEASALDPAAAWALNNLCYLDFRLGRFAEARQHCDAAIRASPGLTVAHNNLGLTLAASGDLDSATTAFLAGGDEATAQFNLGIVHLANERFADAAAAFERAIKARPSFTVAKSRAHDARMRSITHR